MDIKVKNSNAYGKSCIGCRNNQRDIMITFLSGEEVFHDMFLTQEDAKRLHRILGERLEQNEQEAP